MRSIHEWPSALEPSSDPRTKAKSRRRGEDAALAKAREAAGAAQGATGVSEGRSHQRRGKKTPTLMTEGREAPRMRFSC
jgi:hypothetical protein